MKCEVIECQGFRLRRNIDEWLATGDYDIVSHSQTQVDGNITLVIFYLDLQARRDRKLESIID